MNLTEDKIIGRNKIASIYYHGTQRVLHFPELPIVTFAVFSVDLYVVRFPQRYVPNCTRDLYICYSYKQHHKRRVV